MAGNIQTYQDRVDAPRATSAGSEAAEIEGRHVEASYAEAGNAIGRGIGEAGRAYGDYEVMKDTSAISAQGATAFANLSNSLRSTMAQGDINQSDATAAKWRDEAMEQGLQDIGANANTRQGKEMAERMQNTLREEFTRQSIGAASTLAGVAIKNNLEQTKNGLAQAVSNDPTLLPTALDMLHGTMADQIKSHPSLSAEDIGRINSEFTNPAMKDLGWAAFQTAAKNNPQGAKDALTSGLFAGVFSGEEIGHANAYADAQAKAQVEANKAAQTAQKAADKQAYDQSVDGIIATMLKPDGSIVIDKGVPQAIVSTMLMPGATPGESRSLVDMVKAINDRNAKGIQIQTDPHMREQFDKKLLDGSLTDRDLYQASADGLLGNKDLTKYRQGIRDLAADPAKKAADKQFNDWINAQKPAFTHSSALSLTGSDPQGMARWDQFKQDAYTQYSQAYAQKGDWQGMLRQGSPNYLGTQAKAYMHLKGNQGVPNLTGTVMGGYKFTGTGPDQWKDQKYWTKVGQ